MTRAIKGKVYLVGAGPGHPDLLTVRGAKLLSSCDIVFYDRLVSDEILHLIPERTKVVCIGTDHMSDPANKQGDINRRLLESAKKGLTVMRLKCGDPFLFGRGGEEIKFLLENNVPCEVVPGISSALGVPTFAGIPLTHREYSSSVIVVSGHRKEKEENDWNAIARFNGTIVILMGLGRIAEIMKKLLGGHIDPDTRVAVIQKGTLRGQKIVTGNVGNIADLVDKRKLVSPSLIVIGKVVDLIMTNHTDHFQNHR